MEVTHVYAADITKAERDENGDLIVTGTASSNRVDIDQQIADPDWLKSALPAWQVWGNVREQHSKIAAGIGLELDEKDPETGTWNLKSAVIDESTAKKVERGVLKGYSIGIKGPRIVKDATAKNGRIVGGEIVEISLVDRPANPDCTIMLAKAASDDKGAEFEPVDIDKAADDKVDCPTCDGDGKIMAGKRDCPDCDATGKVTPEKAASLKKSAEPLTVEVSRDIGWKTESIADGQQRITIPPEILKAIWPELAKKDYTDDERSDMASKGQAIPGGGFPIKNTADLKNAIQAIGRAKDPAAAKAHIKKRAAALGQEGLIPDTWKTATADTWTHDPQQVADTFKAICALLQAEIDEWTKGEDESCDVSELLCAAQMVANWAKSEANEGEIPQPFTQGDDTMSLISLGVDADLIKAASAEDATDEAKDALRDATQKALGIDTDKIAAATADSVKGLFEERSNALEERLARVEGAAAPGGPVTTRTNAESAKASEADHLRAEATRYLQIADQVDHETAKGYRQKAADCEAAARKLATA